MMGSIDLYSFSKYVEGVGCLLLRSSASTGV